MLYQVEKDYIVDTMKMFANTHLGEDLVKQTARYVSSSITTWKRKMVYDYSRELFKDRYEEPNKDVYIFEIDGRQEYWNCVLWYDGPRIFEDAAETRIMVQSGELSILERFDIIYCSNDYYNKMVDAENSTIRKIQKTLAERGIRERKVFMFYDRSKDIYPVENAVKEEEVHKIHDWTDELYDTNPEWFI